MFSSLQYSCRQIEKRFNAFSINILRRCSENKMDDDLLRGNGDARNRRRGCCLGDSELNF